MYRLVLTFRSAGLHRKSRKPTGAEHVMLTPEGKVNRIETGRWVDAPWDTIFLGSITNMFRVLFDVRPIPSFRGYTESHQQESHRPDIEDLARRSLIRITSNISKTRDGEVFPILEVQQTSKIMADSWRRSRVNWAGPDPLLSRVTWGFVQRSFSPKRFDAFRELVVSVLGPSALKLDMIQVFGGLYLSKHADLAAFFDMSFDDEVSKISKAFSETLLHGKTAGQYFGHTPLYRKDRQHWDWLREIRGLAFMCSRDGEIWVDITDAQYQELKAGPRTAKLLDGGVVQIKDCFEIFDGDPMPSDLNGKSPFDPQEKVCDV